MMELPSTRHAEKRLQQRCISDSDVQMILRFGTETRDGAILLARDYMAVDTEARRFLSRLERLIGTAVILQGGSIITAYKAKREKQKRMLRGR